MVVGSSGFRSDYQLASLPGLKRSFLRLKSDDNLSFFKTSFEDIESTATDLVTKVRADYPSLRNVIESYKTVILASRIVSLESNALDIIYSWLATYANVRGWGTASQTKNIKKVWQKL